MGEHYYTHQPSSESNPKSFTCDLKGFPILFTSDSGVFSKSEIDFGSKLLIEEFEEPEIQGDFIDVGCGYGPIGIALAKSYPNRKIAMVDINERAIDLAKGNCEKNQVYNTTVFKSNLFESVEQNFAAIITNPPIRAGKQTVHKLFKDAYDHLLANGELWIVIQKKQGAPSAIAFLETLFQEVIVAAKKKGYYIVRSKKY